MMSIFTGSMILLGSIQRTELQRILDAYIQRDPRDIYVDEPEPETASPGAPLTSNGVSPDTSNKVCTGAFLSVRFLILVGCRRC